MWTPKRILLLVFGLFLFMSGYFLYGHVLGGIDGLPPLPPELWAPTGLISGKGSEILVSVRPNPLGKKISEAFGPGCEELHRPIKLELNSKSTILTAETYSIEPDGRLRLEPLSVALFGKVKKDAHGKDIQEINTIRCKKAFLKFDRPLVSFTDVNGRKVIAAELMGDIRVVNNRGTPEREDDLCVFINNGPLLYEESTHLIKTHDLVHLVDGKSRPPMDVKGTGLEMELAVEAPPAPAGTGAAYKPKGETITGVKRIVLQANVEMHLYVDARSGFPGIQATEAAKEGSVATNALVGKPANPAAPAPTPEKAHVTIKAPGRFQYDLLKDHDLAHFDVATNPAAVLLNNSPQDVIVTRHIQSQNTIDQLICQQLDLRLHRKDNKAAPGQAPAATEQTMDRGLDIEVAHAVGNTGTKKEVTITSDAEKLDAQCSDLLYDARTQVTILKGEPQMAATKDGSKIKARELRIQEFKPTTPGGKGYQQATAAGPGRIDLIDKDPAKKPVHALWDDTLVSTKDGIYDLFTLTRAAKFIDEDHGQTLQGDVLKVWLDPAGDKPAAAPATTAQPVDQQARRPHHLEAYGNVQAHSSEMNIHETSRLVVWFKDVPALPATLPTPLEAATQPGTIIPTPAAAVSPNHQVEKEPVAGEKAHSGTPRPDAKKEEGPPRPIDLTARSVEATVLRSDTKNTLEKLRCDGKVQVKQDPAKPDEKGVDIQGSKLTMDYHPDGNYLVVTGDGHDGSTGENDVATLQMDKIYIVGTNEVHINQASNKAWVMGPGAMKMDSNTSFSGEQLKRSVPLTIHWNESMLFNGKYAEFHGGIQGEQENARLASESLVVFFDRPISLKDGNKTEQPAHVQHLLCDRSVRIEDSVFEGKERIKFQEITGVAVEMNQLYPEVDDPLKKEQVSDGNEVRARGPGEVRIMQKGGLDPTPTPAGAPGNAAAGNVPKPKPATPNKPKPANPDEEQMKMTYVNYGTSMYTNSKKNFAKFIGNVRVLNMPCEEPHLEINLDLVLDKMPEGAMYLRSDILEVWSHQVQDRKYNEMHASGRALVQSNEFWGRAATIHFDEAKDQVIFDGGDGGKATLFKITGKGKQAEKIEGKKIIYVRSTGQCYIEGGKTIEGLGAPGQ